MKALLLMSLVLAGCHRTATPPTPTATPTATAPSTALRPMKLRYHGEHSGDHPTWIYTAHVAVDPATHEGKPAWRRSYRFEHVGQTGSSDIEGTILVDRDTLAPLESSDAFGAQRSHIVFRPDRVDATETSADGTATPSTFPVQGFVVTDVWKGFDLYVLGLPLREGFRANLQVLYDTGKPLRPFSLSVERIERVRVPAGEFNAFRLLLEPLDGDERQRSIYHVRSDGKPLVLRKEYVVNPRTEGQMKRSTGVEELEAIELD